MKNFCTLFVCLFCCATSGLAVGTLGIRLLLPIPAVDCDFAGGVALGGTEEDFALALGFCGGCVAPLRCGNIGTLAASFDGGFLSLVVPFFAGVSLEALSFGSVVAIVGITDD